VTCMSVFPITVCVCVCVCVYIYANLCLILYLYVSLVPFCISSSQLTFHLAELTLDTSIRNFLKCWTFPILQIHKKHKLTAPTVYDDFFPVHIKKEIGPIFCDVFLLSLEKGLL
jgi:hypothetical protein